jgi:hypothetical protein
MDLFVSLNVERCKSEIVYNDILILSQPHKRVEYIFSNRSIINLPMGKFTKKRGNYDGRQKDLPGMHM